MNPASKSSKWYQSILELPFRVFSDINATGDLSLLVISGKPTEAELAATWEAIQLQYADEMKEPEYRNYIRVQRELTAAQIVHTQVTMLIQTLDRVYVEEFKRELDRLLHCYLVLDPADPEGYDQGIKRAKNRLKGHEINIQLKIAEMDAIAERLGLGKGEKPTRKYFWNVIEGLQNYYKFEMDIEKTTTYQVCVRYRNMVDEVERMKTPAKK